MSTCLKDAIVVIDCSDAASLGSRYRDMIAQAHECAEAVHAIVVSQEERESLREELGRLGVSSCVFLQVNESVLTASALSPALASAYSRFGNPQAPLLFASRFLDRECAASLAITLGGCAIAEAVALRVEDGHLCATTDALGGTWRAEIATHSAPACVCVRSRGLEVAAEENECVELATEVVEPDPTRTLVVERVEASSDGRPSVTDAQVVVVGGRGAGNDWSLVEDLADVLGAGIGATRDAVDEGWARRSAQIGQTGLTIAPKLYISLGVSGAIHHTVGIMSSQTIVAICDDPDAPIFELADFGVVGDMYEIVHKALEHLRAWQASRADN